MSSASTFNWGSSPQQPCNEQRGKQDGEHFSFDQLWSFIQDNYLKSTWAWSYNHYQLSPSFYTSFSVCLSPIFLFFKNQVWSIDWLGDNQSSSIENLNQWSKLCNKFACLIFIGNWMASLTVNCAFNSVWFNFNFCSTFIIV